MNSRNRLVGVGTGMAATAIAGLAGAAMIYTDRAHWSTAMIAVKAGPFIVDPFDHDIANDEVITFESGVESRGINGQATNDVLNGAYGGNVDSDKDAFDPVTQEPVDTFEAITWKFPAPIIGFGADFIEATTGEVLLISGNFDGTGDRTVDLLDILGSPGTGFFGIVSDVPFYEITFHSRTDDSTLRINEFFLADNLIFGSREPDVLGSDPDTGGVDVAEPFSSLAIFAVGAAAMRFRQRQSQLQ
jgi:hypothetical protein